MEKVYQYVWKHRMLGRRLPLCGGGEVDILDPGTLNTDAGPDFFNAKIKIGTTEWVGNVEVHVKASDWMRHGHSSDAAYGNVILHVVAVNDIHVKRADGSVIPCVEIPLSPEFFAFYSNICSDIQTVRCASGLPSLSSLAVTDWMESLAVARLQQRAGRMLERMEANGGDWENTVFVFLARALGFGLNGDPFEMLARSIPLNRLSRHSDNLFQIEAVLFGQAGMLDSSRHIFDEYYQNLCREYYFLARKYDLRPMKRELWKYARTRPHNFPHRRIALLARVLEGGFSLHSTLLGCRGDIDRLRERFRWDAGPYWQTHADFDVEAENTAGTLSVSSIDSLLINVVAPLYYAYATRCGAVEFADMALDILSGLKPERNTVIRAWDSLGLKASDARESQALLHLRKEYCDKRRCLDCRFAYSAMKNMAGSSVSGTRYAVEKEICVKQEESAEA